MLMQKYPLLSVFFFVIVIGDYSEGVGIAKSYTC